MKLLVSIAALGAAVLAVTNISGCSPPARVTDQFFNSLPDKNTATGRQEPGSGSGYPPGRTVRRSFTPAELSLEPSPNIELIPFSDDRSAERNVKQMHTVRKGDTLTKLARRYYNDSGKWRLIYNANRTIIKNPDNLPAGVRLRVPPLP